MPIKIDYAAARHNMVECQIRPNRISDERLIQALYEIPREKYMPDEVKNFAYCDQHLSFGKGRFILSPLSTSTLLQHAQICDHDVVLVIGCGLGYFASLVAKLAASVTAIDDNPELIKSAEKTCAEADIHNLTFVTSNLDTGCPKMAPYTIILIEGAVDEVPAQLFDQLDENGRIYAIIQKTPVTTELTLFKKIKNTIGSTPLCTLSAPALSDFKVQPGFRF